MRYLTNFTGTTGLAVITLEKAFFVTDFRYTEQAAAQAQGFEIVKIADRFLKKLRLFAKRRDQCFGFRRKLRQLF